MVAVRVDQIFMSNVGYVVFLKGEEDERSLPIFIGEAEAHSIAICLRGVTMPRPLTHDLLKRVLDFLECRLKRVEVSDLRDSTFFSRLVLERDGEELSMDARPSDAIALALRCSAPIHVEDAVMDEAGRIYSEIIDTAGETGEVKEGSSVHRHTVAPAAEPLDPVASRLDRLKGDLDTAVSDERYEDAARLRDEIQKLEHGHKPN